MSISPKQIGIVIGGGISALLAGTLISAGLKADAGKTITLATLLTLPTAVGIHLIIDTQAAKRVREAEAKVSKAESKASQAKYESAENFEKWQLTKAQLEQVEKRNSQLLVELATIQQALEETRKNLELSETERANLAGMATQLQQSLVELQERAKSDREHITELEAEIEQWESTFLNRVELAADERFKVARRTEIERIFAEHDAITGEAMALFRRLQAWAVKIADSHESKRTLITSLAQSYNGNLDEINTAVDKERDGYLRQIEILHGRVGQLQQQLAGDLVEPVYLEVGFSPEGRIANAIANWLWHNRQIPLKVSGFEIASDGVVTCGYSYPRSMAPEALVKAIEDDSPTIARNLGLYAIEKPQKLQVTDCLTVKARRERPARKTEKGSLYRSKEEFIKYILSQPVRLRVIGEPGSGKTPTVAILIAHILNRGFLSANTPNGQKLPYCVVESCNPLAGISVKNSDALDFCLVWNDGKKGFKGLAEEYRFRKNPANTEYKNQVGYIWIADEIDNTMAELTKDEAKPFKDSLKDGGHVNLGVIVMGQSAMVSTSKGLSIDDQKMMTNIYIDPVSIRTFLTQYGERFYSKKAVEKALFTLEELELEIEEQNEIICDTAREFRIAMVTANRSPVFYQLPYFDSAEIDVEGYQQMLDKVSAIREGRGETRVVSCVPVDSDNAYTASLTEGRDTSGHSPMSGLGTRPDTSVKPTCPHCGSRQIRSKGDKWLCQNPEHSIVASDKPKSWKK